MRLNKLLDIIIINLFFNINADSLWLKDDTSWQSSNLDSNAICVDIPANMTLCKNIGYKKMRLPNLLHHDSLQEVSQQSSSWIQLIKLGCNPDTQLFLCSLFTPVCLGHPIPPCRSLCQSVQSDCETIMLKYGYPWPKIVDCNQFPIDNDMCIKAQYSLSSKTKLRTISPENMEPQVHHFNPSNIKEKDIKLNKAIKSVAIKENSTSSTFSSPLSISSIVTTSSILSTTSSSSTTFSSSCTSNQELDNSLITKKFQDILDLYCSSDWSIKARISLKYKKLSNTNKENINYDKHNISLIISKNYKLLFGNLKGFKARMHTINWHNSSVNPLELDNRRRYFIMGTVDNDYQYTAIYLIQWPQRSSQFRKFLKTIKTNHPDCTKEVKVKSSKDTDNIMVTTAVSTSLTASVSSNTTTKLTEKLRERKQKARNKHVKIRAKESAK